MEKKRRHAAEMMRRAEIGKIDLDILTYRIQFSPNLDL